MHNRHIFARARVCQIGHSLCLLFPFYSYIFSYIYFYLLNRFIYILFSYLLLSSY